MSRPVARPRAGIEVVTQARFHRFHAAAAVELPGPVGVVPMPVCGWVKDVRPSP
mgnify:CR=1 FL=1